MQLDGVHTVPKVRVVKYTGALDAVTMEAGARTIILALGLDCVSRADRLGHLRNGGNPLNVASRAPLNTV